MAKYNRDFLVPYLQNICALHLTQRKLNQKIGALNSKIYELNKGKQISCPNYPQLEPKITFGRIVSMVVGGFLDVIAFLGLVGFFTEGEHPSFLIAVVVLGVVGTICICCGGQFMRDAEERNEKALRDYRHNMEIYNQTKEANLKGKRLIPNVEAERNRWIKEYNVVTDLLQRAYSANIIPKQYRNIYPAVYLYDWFSSTREDDVTMALNMFVLEEIKAKLDYIIARQSEIILNQCMIEANQRKTIEQQESHTRMMQSKLDQIQASNEERNSYLSMIESNTRANAYFAAADYIGNL